MLKRAIWIFLLSLGTLLRGALIDPNVQAATEGDPSNTICDSVSLLTGDFVVFSEDLVIDGAEPLHVFRQYISGDGTGYNGGWEFFPHLTLTKVPEKIIGSERNPEGKRYRRIKVAEPNGTTLTLRKNRNIPVKGKSIPFIFDFKKHGKGVTNIARGQISARTNLKNYLLKQESDKYATLYCADGTIRKYRKFKDGVFPKFHLMEEILPNENRILYQYREDDRIELIQSTNKTGGKTYAWCLFHYNDSEKKNHDFTIETSDGRELSYVFKTKKGKKKKEPTRFFLKEVTGSEIPSERAKYNKHHHYTDQLVKSRILPDGRLISIEYYQPSTTYEIGEHEVKTAWSTDPGVDRVKTLYQSLGENGELIATHHFIYDIERHWNNFYWEYEKNGKTDVYDAYQNKTSVHYTKDFLPYEVYYHEKEKLHHKTKMQWGEYGQLEKKFLTDADDKPLLKKIFQYDWRGNLLEEKLLGNICEKGSDDIIAKSHKYDEKNRLIESKNESGLITRITYLRNTPLVLTKYITDEDTIHIREFNEYSDDNILITKIIDDGTSGDAQDLTNVSMRTLTRIHPKKEAPAQNLPEIIEEKALDLATMEEILLKRTVLHYNKQARIIQKDIYDSENTFAYSLKFAYDNRGNIKEEIAPDGTITSYTYDIHGNCISQIDPNQKKTLSRYDCANRLIEEEEIAPDGTSRLTKYQYDHKNNKIATIDPFGNTTHYEYDAFGNQIKIIYPNGAVETNTYNELGHVIEHCDPNEGLTKTKRNAFGMPLEINHPNQAIETYTYYPNGELKTHTDSDRLTLHYTYDALGRKIAIQYLDSQENLLASETFTYNSFHLISQKDKEEVLTTYTYDAFGRKIAEEKADRRIEFDYDSLGRIHKEIICNENNTLITTYERDLHDRVIEERSEDLSGTLLQETFYTYDLLGNQTSITCQNAIETFVYDVFNRLISHTTGQNDTTLTIYDENHLNENGERVLRKITKDPCHYRTIETYDVMMRLSAKQIQSPNDIILFAEDYERDLCGNNILQSCHIYHDGIYASTFGIEKTYDLLNQVTATTEAIETPDSKTTHFTYTPGGKHASTKKPDGITLYYTYNPLGHLSSLTTSDGSISYTYIHDRRGNLLKSSDQKTTTKRVLDPLGNLLQETLANGLQINNQYDKVSRRTQLILPNHCIDYNYGPLHLTEVRALGQSATYTYDLRGNCKTLHLGKLTKYRYDKMGRPTQLYNPDYTQVLHYDPRGNIVEILTNHSLYQLEYNGLKQLIEEQSHNYSYDSYYNRLSKDLENYQVNATHILLQAGQATYTHDANGNPLSQSAPQITYKYDALDRLIEVITPTTHTTYTYDSFHRRMTKTTSRLKKNEWTKPTTVRFLYDGDDEIGAYDENDHPIELRILGHREKAERETLLIQLKNTTYRCITDLHGNIVRLTSLDRTQDRSHYYNAFGEEAPSPSPNPWRYCSKRYDPETRLIYFGRRYYSPETGRFLTPDPSAFTDSVNLYAYTYNNPYTNQDLYGRFSNNYQNLQSPYPLSGAPPREYEFQYHPFNQQAEYLYKMPGMDHTLPSFERPTIYSLDNRPEIPNQRIMFMNGIMNDLETTKENAAYISRFAGGHNVHGVHSPTYGPALDTLHALHSLHYKITQPALLLHSAWDHYFDKSGPDATILMVGHSRGNIEVRNSLMTYDKKRRKRIYVLGIAPAAYVDPRTCGGVRNYVSQGDLVHKLDTYGARKFADTITHLPRHPESQARIDHSFQSPTFENPIRRNINSYLKNGYIE